MDLKDLKKEAEKFRKYVAGFDKNAIAAQADSLVKANPGDADCSDLAASLKACADGDAVEVVLDEVKART